MTYRSLAEISELIRQHHVSPVDLVNECLQKIERLNPALRAFITVTGDQARQEAERAETEIANGKWRGPLHGIPVGIKDFFDTAGVRTTAAFAAFENRVPTKDAEAVRRLREAGAIVVGKTNMHELGMGTTSVISHFGSVHNPWNPGYVAGGSSGGSAAAIAAGLCYATLDTDAIGSCRLPASCCGVTGFKATYGLVSTKGILDGEPADEFIIRLGHAAFMCRSADDAAILLNVLGDPGASKSKFKADYRAAIGSTTRPRLGVVTDFKATPEVRAAFLGVIDTFHALEYATTDVEAPLEFPSVDLGNIEEDRATISQRLFKEIQALLLPTTTDVTPTIEEAKERGPPGGGSGQHILGELLRPPGDEHPLRVQHTWDAVRVADRRATMGRGRDFGYRAQISGSHELARPTPKGRLTSCSVCADPRPVQDLEFTFRRLS